MHSIARFAMLLLLSLLVACKREDSGKSMPGPDKSATASGAAAAEVLVAYGSEKKTWLEEQVKLFAATNPKTKSGRPIRINAKAMGSGEAMQGILDGTVKAHVFSPASAVYVSLLNSAWQAKSGRAKPIAQAGDPLVLSPIVVAIWKPMAEALGWPGKPIGWSDLLRVNADPKGWGAFNHP
jgi:Ca-activated chloride channel family protein